MLSQRPGSIDVQEELDTSKDIAMNEEPNENRDVAEKQPEEEVEQAEERAFSDVQEGESEEEHPPQVVNALGAVPLSLHGYILLNHGTPSFKDWRSTLPAAARKIFSTDIQERDWYDSYAAVTLPTRHMCSMFYRGSLKGAWASGKYSADYGFNVLMRAFARAGSTSFLLKHIVKILTRYYQGTEMEVMESDNRFVRARLTHFPNISPEIEHRIGGWVERAVEISSGSRKSRVVIGQSLSKAHPHTEYIIEW